MNGDRLLTVVVPIYNVEAYLGQCLESLLSQTDPCFSVVMINDGSTDKSGSIARRYADEHSEMFIYAEQENGGLGSARNHGIRLTSTEYVTFLDSDDWWMPQTAEKIHEVIRNIGAPPDLIFTSPKTFDMATNQYGEWKDNEYIKEIFDQFGPILSPRIVTKLYGTEASVCRIVIRTDILRRHGFQFPEGIKWEDVFPHFALLNWSQRCVLVRDAGFIYRKNTGTQITSLADKSRLDIGPSFARAYSYAYEHHWSLEEKAYIFDMMMAFVTWFADVTNKEIYPELIQSLHDFSKAIPDECYKAYCRIKHPPRKTRMLWIFIKTDYLYRMIKSYDRYQRLKRVFFRIKKTAKKRIKK